RRPDHAVLVDHLHRTRARQGGAHRLRPRGSSSEDADSKRRGRRGDRRGVPAADRRGTAGRMRIVVVVQARTGSTRLPGKVLMPLADRPLLQRMLERVLAAQTPSEVVVATTHDPSDGAIEVIANAVDVRCFRGHPTDLLDRHYRAGLACGADVVVKIPSDCPLIDPAVIDRVIGHYAAHADSADFVSNLQPGTYPDGNDVEVIPLGVLETAWREATEDHEREHTTPFIWERPDRFRIHHVAWETGLDYSSTHRWTIDYPEDYHFLAAVYDALWTEARPLFSLEDVMTLLDARPEIAGLHACHLGKAWYSERGGGARHARGRRCA